MRVIGDVIRLNAKRFPDKKALITDDGYLTYFDLNSKANQLVHGLLARGTKPGDRISIIAFNSLEWMVVFFAVAKIGAVLVPINFRYKKDELVYVLNHSESSILFFGPEFTSLVEEAKSEVNNPPCFIPIESQDGASGMKVLMEGMPTTEPSVTVEPAWPFSIIYTSGTTGKPKGALTQHGSFVHNYISMMVDCDVQDDEVCLASLPFFHTAGVHCLIGPVFLKGGTCVITSPGFDAERVLDAVARYRITMALWVPTQLAILVNSSLIGKYDISSLRRIWYGSSPIPPPVLEACLKKLKVGFYQVYGETETLMVSVQRPEDHYGERSQYTGREFFNAELRIVDEEGRDVEAGAVGEIISRQQGSGMLCYFKDEEVTKETIRDGWIHTGDIARLEKGGYFTIVDRIKDLIISGGENVYPKEIENIISTHPAVKEVAVYGIPDDVWGESVCAAVVKNEEQEVDEKGIINFCANKLSAYKKPSRVIFVDELPRNSLGKVTKNSLREPFWAGRERRI